MTETLPGGPHQEADAAAPFCSKLGSVILSQSVDWPLSQLNGVSHSCNSRDVSTTVKTFKKSLVGVQWYSVLVSQPHSPSCLQESRFPNTKSNKFKGGHVSTGNSPFPQPEGRRPSCAMVPGWCWFPLQPLVPWSSTSG